MRLLGYLTTDPLNAAAAEALAADHGMDLRIVEPRDLLQLERNPIDLVVDWDFIPEDYRDSLLNGTAANIVAIHGYGLSDSLASFLPRSGIICSRRLDEYLIRTLGGLNDVA